MSIRVILLSILLFVNYWAKAQNITLIRQIDSINSISYEQKILTNNTNLNKFIEALKLSQQIHYQKGIADSYANIALIYYYQGKYDLNSKYLLGAIEQYEALGMTEQVANLYSLYGYGLKYRDTPKALKFMQQGIKLAEKNNHFTILKAMYDNYGVVKEITKDYDSAFYFYNKALKMKQEDNDKIGIPYSLNKLAMLYLILKKYDLAKQNLDKAYQIRLDLKDKIGIAENLNFYGIYYDSLKQHQKALAYFEQALEASKKVGYNYLTQQNYQSLSSILERNHDYRQALAYFKKNSLYKDSLENILMQENRNELEVAFETNQKEKEILIQRAKIAESRTKIEQKNLQILGVISLLLIALIISYQIYITQKQRNLQLLKENELKDALNRIEVQNRLQEQRLRISRDLHDNIGSQLTFIISSIDSLRYHIKNENPEIQHKLQNINTFTRNTIFELRDTIWAMNKDFIMFDDLRARINNFIEKADVIINDTNFSFDIDPELMKLQLNSFEGINIYRIVQEGINNAIKYAQASLISVRINKLQNSIQIIIEDNGKGFDTHAYNPGNGLDNLKKRSEEIGGSLLINSHIGSGTQLIITI